MTRALAGSGARAYGRPGSDPGRPPRPGGVGGEGGNRTGGGSGARSTARPRIARPGSDPLWSSIVSEIEAVARAEPLLEEFLTATVLGRSGLEDALASILARKLAAPDLPAERLREIFDAAHAQDPGLAEAARADIRAVRERDPAAEHFHEPLLYFKGFHSLQGYRITHWLWREGRRALAFLLQSRISSVFAVDIHPAARIGRGILIDHATSVVIGETAVVEDNVSILHEVTLGGTGKEHGDRHPKVRAGVLIGAGAKLLGNIEIGEGAKIGAGSVVLDHVPPHCTVAGVPAVVIGEAGCPQPALEMDHRLEGARDGGAPGQGSPAS